MLQSKEEIERLTDLIVERLRSANLYNPPARTVIEQAIYIYVGATRKFRTQSTYNVTCMCGTVITSVAKSGICGCGKHWVVE